MSFSWNQEYYDIINFFYWEPQHLGKKQYEESRYKSLGKVLDHIQNMEVSLNHIFNIYFKLIPDIHLNKLFKLISSNINSDRYKLQFDDDIEKLNIGDATQPDLSFIGDKNLLAIEMKIGAKTDVDQVMKYALLFYFQEFYSKKKFEKKHLIYLTPHKFDKVFKEKLSSEEELKIAIEEYSYNDSTKKGKVDLVPHKSQMKEIAKNMSIDFITYKDFYRYINDIIDSINPDEVYSDSIIRLHEGIINELEIRNLI